MILGICWETGLSGKESGPSLKDIRKIVAVCLLGATVAHAHTLPMSDDAKHGAADGAACKYGDSVRANVKSNTCEESP